MALGAWDVHLIICNIIGLMFRWIYYDVYYDGMTWRRLWVPWMAPCLASVLERIPFQVCVCMRARMQQ